MAKWYCIDLQSLFTHIWEESDDSGSWEETDWIQLNNWKFVIERSECNQQNDYYYDIKNGSVNLCCDGEQVKLIKVEGDNLTFLSEGVDFDSVENESDYYFTLTKEEALHAGIEVDDIDKWSLYCDYLIDWANIHRTPEFLGMCPVSFNEWCDNEGEE